MLLRRPKRPRVVSDPTRFRNQKKIAGNSERTIFGGSDGSDDVNVAGVIFLLCSRFFFGLLVVQTELVEGGVIYMRFEEHIGQMG